MLLCDVRKEWSGVRLGWIASKSQDHLKKCLSIFNLPQPNITALFSNKTHAKISAYIPNFQHDSDALILQFASKSPLIKTYSSTCASSHSTSESSSSESNDEWATVPFHFLSLWSNLMRFWLLSWLISFHSSLLNVWSYWISCCTPNL
jgi:hypothetical protein